MQALFAWVSEIFRQGAWPKAAASDTAVREPDRRLVMAMVAAGMILGALLWPQSASLPPEAPSQAMKSPGPSHASFQSH